MRITKSKNRRIEVVPEDFHIETVGEILRQIKRHVDKIVSAKYAETNYEACSHCGSAWETDEDGSPLCCNAAVDEWKRNLVVNK